MPTISTAAPPIFLHKRHVSPSLDGAAQLAWSLLSVKTIIVFLVPALIFTDRFVLFAVSLGVAILADILDGWVFGKSALAQRKEYRDRRRIADTLTDRLLIAATIVPLYLVGALPAAFLALVIARELAIDIVTAGPYIFRGFVCKPNHPSRIGTALVAAQTALLALGGPLSTPLLLIIVICSTWGVALYAVRPRAN